MDTKRMKIFVPFFIFCLFTSIASGEALYVADNDGPERDITNISDAIKEANYSSFKEINNFTTFPLDAGNYLFSFAVATDIHWSSSDSISNFGRMYKYTDQLLADVVTAINAESVNFTILLGNLTDNGLAYEFDNVTKRLNKLDKPFYPVIGNHDKSEGAWVTEWAELGPGNTTYIFNFAGWHFIVLDTVNDSNTEQGILTDDITKWVQDDLKVHNTMPTIICLHFLVNRLVAN
uniref:3',5'-cyclic adenosine monophosphate phosphodiesterase CpdA n=1 Tax=uncultured Methanosarcinales archaeon TaxID=183757 RepID=A0A7H1KNM7_9EURY|nr:3',5'-cyclic adenosine monophosphate phosphodiesterase CpdA [uncultured Methanosarcinales archaeon]